MSDAVNPHDSHMSDDDVLRYTQRKRREFVEEVYFKREGGFPNDPKEQAIMLSAMADMDRSAINNKRIGAAEKQAAADGLVARALASLGKHFGADNPFEGNTEMVVPSNLPHPDMKALPAANPVPGETDVGLGDETYNSLMKKFDDEESGTRAAQPNEEDE